MAKPRSVITSEGKVLKVAFERAVLRVLAGPDERLVYEVADRPVVIGRTDQADLKLRDTEVSRLHARIQPQGEGWLIEDLKSKSGTFVEGAAVEFAPLQPGRRIKLGLTELALTVDTAELRIEPESTGSFEGLLGECLPMRQLFGLIRRISALDLPVLLQGEPGSGKAVLARALHRLSSRGRHPYEVVDCSQIVEQHLQSELFGHARAAFPGAAQSRQGAFERAEGGTVVLDQVGELPLQIQPQLLRVLEEGEVRPLGGRGSIRVRARVIATTPCDLDTRVRAGRFRPDLFHRLTAMAILVPPLRERPGDVELLATQLLPPGRSLEPAVLDELRAHPWPGNVRELKAYVRQLGSQPLDKDSPPAMAGTLGYPKTSPPRQPLPDSVATAGEITSTLLPDSATESGSLFEESVLRDALARFQGNRKLAAERLGITRATLARRLKELGID